MATASNDSRDGDSEAEPMDVEDDAVYAKRHGDNMEVSGPDKEESEQMANADWEQLGETTKSKENREKFVRDTAKTYEKARSRFGGTPIFWIAPTIFLDTALGLRLISSTSLSTLICISASRALRARSSSSHCCCCPRVHPPAGIFPHFGTAAPPAPSLLPTT